MIGIRRLDGKIETNLPAKIVNYGMVVYFAFGLGSFAGKDHIESKKPCLETKIVQEHVEDINDIKADYNSVNLNTKYKIK